MTGRAATPAHCRRGVVAQRRTPAARRWWQNQPSDPSGTPERRRSELRGGGGPALRRWTTPRPPAHRRRRTPWAPKGALSERRPRVRRSEAPAWTPSCPHCPQRAWGQPYVWWSGFHVHTPSSAGSSKSPAELPSGIRGCAAPSSRRLASAGRRAGVNGHRTARRPPSSTRVTRSHARRTVPREHVDGSDAGADRRTRRADDPWRRRGVGQPHRERRCQQRTGRLPSISTRLRTGAATAPASKRPSASRSGRSPGGGSPRGQRKGSTAGGCPVSPP
jgi:hypothetical protein